MTHLICYKSLDLELLNAPQIVKEHFAKIYAVKMMREIRDNISSKTHNMPFEALKAYIKQKLVAPIGCKDHTSMGVDPEIRGSYHHPYSLINLISALSFSATICTK
jgi:hypothetical protein